VQDFFQNYKGIFDPMLVTVTGNWRRRSQNGFYTPASQITPSTEEFISPRIQSCQVQRSSSTPNIGAKKLKSNWH